MQSVEAADMDALAAMVGDGRLRVALGLQLRGIEQVPDALAGHSATTGQGHRKGKTVITIDTAVVAEKMHRE